MGLPPQSSGVRSIQNYFGALGNRGDESPTPASIDPDVRAAEMRKCMEALAGTDPLVRVDALSAGYTGDDIVHDIDLRVGKRQALCLIGPSGAGKSTVLHSIFGLTEIRRGRVEVAGRNVTRLGPNAKLRDAGIAYVLRDNSIFPEMTVEQNLWLGGYLMGHGANARRAAEAVFDRYPGLAAYRDRPARLLSCVDLRMLEISRALVMEPRVLLIDEPSMGLNPACIDQIFDLLRVLRDRDGLSIVVVEQNARKALELADIACVMVNGTIAMVGSGRELLNDPVVIRLFLGG